MALPLPSLFVFSLLLSLCTLNISMATDTDPLLAFLQRVQSDALRTMGPTNFDPKLYVDLPLKTDLSIAVTAFNSLHRRSGTISLPDFNKFLEEFFDEAGSDLVYAKPVDFKPEPEGFLVKVENEEMRKWALEVHAIWKNLSRRVSEEVKRRPERHTLLYLPGTVIVPGSRFREVYYWDSYWVIRGLLASKMYDTAKAIVYNLISLIERYGHVLNGARTYYINRSQPPLLSSMVRDIYMRTGDVELLKRALPALLKEHSFWVSDVHKVTIEDQRGHKHCLSRYQARWYQPRPESATLDDELSLKLTPSEKDAFYHELASAAESGWDFSSRWMRNSSDLTTTATTSIIPVDLNTFICKLELDISTFAKITGDNSTSQKFMESSKSRKSAIRSLLWNPTLVQWVDYWLDNHDAHQGVYQWNPGSQNCKTFASNFVPLWLLAQYPESDQLIEEFDEDLITSLKKSGLIREYGIATSLSNTGQQWDLPNGWAPLQHMIVDGLANAHSKEARRLAESIVINWIRTNFAAYKKTGSMHEKYDVESCGEFGGGGEYKPQTGFGWSNGVVLAFLEEFGWPRDRDVSC